MTKYEYRCKNCTSGFSTCINYIIDPKQNTITVRAANTCPISKGSMDYVKPEDYGLEAFNSE